MTVMAAVMATVMVLATVLVRGVTETWSAGDAEVTYVALVPSMLVRERLAKA